MSFDFCLSVRAALSDVMSVSFGFVSVISFAVTTVLLKEERGRKTAY